MAFSPYQLVLRNFCSWTARSGLPRLRLGFRVFVQFLLRGGRTAPPSAATRPLVAPDSRRDWRLSRSRHRRGAAACRHGRRSGVARGDAAHRAWPSPRAAASGTDANGYQACLLRKSTATRLSGAAPLSFPIVWYSAELDRVRWRAARDRS